MIERHKPAKHEAEIATRNVDKLQRVTMWARKRGASGFN